MSKVFIIGSINQDIVAKVPKIAKPGETIFGENLSYFPGGKGANQAVAAKNSGADTVFVGKIGKDIFGKNMLSYLKEKGVGDYILESNASTTGTALILVDNEGENSIVVIPGANHEITINDCGILKTAKKNDILLLQNEIPFNTIKELLKGAKSLEIKTFLNAAPALKPTKEIVVNLDVLIVNEHEYDTFFGEILNTKNQKELKKQLLDQSKKSGLDIVLTLGSSGAIAVLNDKIYEVRGIKVKAKDATGAGDCFSGSFVAAISEGENEAKSLEFANKAAALSVTKKGASISFPTKKEINKFLA